jgi:C4-type Zn-finger protein
MPNQLELDDLVDEHRPAPCPACGVTAIEHYWQTDRGGAINAFSNVSCEACRYHNGDVCGEEFV